MEISVQDHKRCSVMTVTGMIEAKTLEEFETNLYDLPDQGKINLVLDFSGVDFLNSGGMKAMLTVRKTVRPKGGDIVLAQPSERVLDSLDLAGFGPPFYKVYPTREEAIGSY
jgi:anti-anti-sigma factor